MVNHPRVVKSVVLHQCGVDIARKLGNFGVIILFVAYLWVVIKLVGSTQPKFRIGWVARYAAMVPMVSSLLLLDLPMPAAVRPREKRGKSLGKLLVSKMSFPSLPGMITMDLVI